MMVKTKFYSVGLNVIFTYKGTQYSRKGGNFAEKLSSCERVEFEVLTPVLIQERRVRQRRLDA